MFALVVLLTDKWKQLDGGSALAISVVATKVVIISEFINSAQLFKSTDLTSANNSVVESFFLMIRVLQYLRHFRSAWHY